MKRLTLVRHGNATSSYSEGSDFDRPLTRRGQADAGALGGYLLRAGLVPGLLLSSTAQRARQTTELVARELALPSNAVRYDESLYLAEPAQILKVVQSLGPALEHLMIVGHNPGVSELAMRLAPRARIANLDTATACTLSFEAATWAEIALGSATDAKIEPAAHGAASLCLWP